MKNEKNILLICNTSNSVINFRKEFILFLIQHDYKVTIIASDAVREKEITCLGARFYCVPFSNKSTNPFEFIKTLSKLTTTIKLIEPYIVFTFQIKPNILGVRAAIKNKVRHIFSMIEGLGEPFQAKGISGKFIRFIVSLLYKHSLKHVSKTFFLNYDDLYEFLKRKIIHIKNTQVNLEQYQLL